MVGHSRGELGAKKAVRIKDLVEAGLLRVGTEISYRSRTSVKILPVTEDLGLEFNGDTFQYLSNLATAMSQLSSQVGDVPKSAHDPWSHAFAKYGDREVSMQKIRHLYREEYFPDNQEIYDLIKSAGLNPPAPVPPAEHDIAPVTRVLEQGTSTGEHARGGELSGDGSESTRRSRKLSHKMLEWQYGGGGGLP